MIHVPALISCHLCGCIHQRPTPATASTAPVLRCIQCQHVLNAPIRSPAVTCSCALSALMLFPFALFLPIMSVEKLGHHSSSSIWTGITHLFQHGDMFTAAIIFGCSVLLPFMKITTLLLISTPHVLPPARRAALYRCVEVTGRWGMLDVMLVAILVAIVKLGDAVAIQTHTGLWVFCLCVLLSLCASTTFDSRTIWKSHS